MPTRAKAAFGALLQKGNGAVPEVFSTVSEVKDISGPAVRQLFEEVTNMDSADAYAEHVPTTREAGDVTFSVNLLQDEATQLGLRTDLNAGTLRNWRLVLPGATKRFSFSGYVAEIGAEAPVKGVLMAPVTIKITGKPVFEAHS